MGKVGVVSGKFRLLHLGHKEVITRALDEDINKLVVIIHGNSPKKRYSTIDNLIKSIQDIIDNKKEYEIFVTYNIYESITQWEDYVIKMIGHKNIIMYNSKENYENIKLENKYLECITSKDIGVSEIEEMGLKNATKYLSKEFLKYMEE